MSARLRRTGMKKSDAPHQVAWGGECKRIRGEYAICGEVWRTLEHPPVNHA